MSLWRNRDFLLLWGGQTISQVGSAVTGVAIPLAAVLVLHAGAMQMGILGALNMAPFLLVTLLAGAYADRVRRRPLLIAADLARTALMAAVPALYLLGRLSMGDLYTIAFLTGLATVLFEVSYQSYLPAVVTRAALVDGNSKLEASRAVSQVAGPSLGGLLVQAMGAPLAIAADALSYVFSVASLLFIRGREPVPEPSGHPHIWAEIGEGLRVVVGNRTLWSIAGCTGTSNLFGGISTAIYVLYVVQVLHLSPAALGLVYGIGSAGAFVGALVATRVGRRLGTGPTIIAMILLAGLGSLLVPLATVALAVPFLLAAGVISSFGSTTYNIQQVSLRQSITPDRVLGRMNASMRFLVWGTIPLGSLLGGFLAQQMGLHAALWIGAAGGLTSGLWVMLSPVRVLRHQPSQPALL